MRFGTADLWNTNVGTSRIISKLYKHPLYTPGKAYFDVGVVEAQKILEFTNYVMPICLPMRPIDDEDALEGKKNTDRNNFEESYWLVKHFLDLTFWEY